MKRIVLSTFVSALIFTNVAAQLRVGLIAGSGISRITIKDESVSGELGSDYYYSKGKTRNSITYYGGLLATLRISSSLELRTKLSLNSKSWKEKVVYKVESSGSGTKDSTTSQRTYRINYLEMPLNLIFSSPLGKAKVLFGVGPYFSYALGGKYKMEVEHTITPNSTDSVALINFTSKQVRGTAYDGNRFDFGASLVAGVEFRNGFFIDLNYTVGTKDILSDRYFVFPNRWRVFTVGVGFYFYNGVKTNSNY